MLSRVITLALLMLACNSTGRADDPKPKSEKAKPVSVVSDLEGVATISFLAPVGKVKKGDLVCELDSVVFQEKLTDTQLELARAKADLEVAEKRLILAEIVVQETLALIELESSTLQGAILIAQSDLEAAKDKLAMMSKEQPTTEIIEARRAIQRAEVALAKTKGEWELLQKFGKLRRVTLCEVEVKKAHLEVLTKKAAYEAASRTEKKLRGMIEHCKLTAPVDGIVSHARGVAVGASVPQRRLIFRIIPD